MEDEEENMVHLEVETMTVTEIHQAMVDVTVTEALMTVTEDIMTATEAVSIVMTGTGTQDPRDIKVETGEAEETVMMVEGVTVTGLLPGTENTDLTEVVIEKEALKVINHTRIFFNCFLCVFLAILRLEFAVAAETWLQLPLSTLCTLNLFGYI